LVTLLEKTSAATMFQNYTQCINKDDDAWLISSSPSDSHLAKGSYYSNFIFTLLESLGVKKCLYML